MKHSRVTDKETPETETADAETADSCATERVCDELPLSITIKSGVVIACYLDEYNDEEPQLGRVIKDPRVDSQDVEVEWMVGAYSKSWKLYKQRKGETWKEKIPFNSVLCPVVLDDTGKLSMETIDKLKLTYQQLRK